MIFVIYMYFRNKQGVSKMILNIGNIVVNQIGTVKPNIPLDRYCSGISASAIIHAIMHVERPQITYPMMYLFVLYLSNWRIYYQLKNVSCFETPCCTPFILLPYRHTLRIQTINNLNSLFDERNVALHNCVLSNWSYQTRRITLPRYLEYYEYWYD